jgi:hypothetical protein
VIQGCPVALLRWHVIAAAILLLAANCTPLPAVGSMAIPPIPAGDSRLWFYRDREPYETHQRPYLRLNGQIVGVSEPSGAFHRDVAPGHYIVTVDSYLSSDFGQFAEIDLVARQEAFVKVLSQAQKVGGERAARENFYTRVVPAEVARAAVARLRFYGGN